MRAECIRAIEEMALEDSNTVVVVSDPGPDFMVELAEKHPERLMIEGVSEQAVVGVSAGLASDGLYPFIIMIAVFGTRRCYEQLLLDFGLHRFSGCMVGVGGGLSYSVMGPTHLSVDDLLLTSAIPGSAVIAPADASEGVALLPQVRVHRGLSYLRLSTTTEPLKSAAGQAVLGQGRLLSDAAPVLFISCGAATLEVEIAVSLLKARGVAAGLLHLHTVKPLDTKQVCQSVERAQVVICVEDHRQIGGLSSAVLHALTSTGSRMPARFDSVGLGDSFPEGYGSYEEITARHGIQGQLLAERAQRLLFSAT